MVRTEFLARVGIPTDTTARLSELWLIMVKHEPGIAMTGSCNNGLQALHSEVQRLLGQCMLHIQQYELLMKTVVIHFEVSGPVHSLEIAQAKRTADIGRKTLGNLVSQLLGSYLTTEDELVPAEVLTAPTEGGPSVTVRMQISLSADDFAKTENGLRELVLLRNSLVHHFIEQHNLLSLDGCRAAQDALIAARSRIKHHFDDLRQWAEDLEQTRRQVAEFAMTGTFRDFMVDGINPDGTVHWPIAAIVRALREAAAALRVEGWAPIIEAGEWVSERYPGQLPAKYGCRSWRQVLHESGFFEVSYRQTDGQRAALYREKTSALNS